MSRPAPSDRDDEQMKLEMRAMAELLLDIYEYRLQRPDSASDEDSAVLDATHHDRTMEERSTFKSKTKRE